MYAESTMRSILFAALLVWLAAACTGGCRTAGDMQTSGPGITDVAGTGVVVDAAEVIVGQSYPVQARLLITGAVVDACDLAEPTIEQEGSSFTIGLEMASEEDARQVGESV